jgi:hypothetical protein
MSLTEIYLQVPPKEIAYVKFIFESYEVVGIIRTVDRKSGVIVLLAADDFIGDARAIVASLKAEIPLTEIPRPPNIGEDWLIRELASGGEDP